MTRPLALDAHSTHRKRKESERTKASGGVHIQPAKGKGAVTPGGLEAPSCSEERRVGNYDVERPFITEELLRRRRRGFRV